MKRSLLAGAMIILAFLFHPATAQQSDYGFIRDYSVKVYDSALIELTKAWDGGMNSCHFNEIDIDFDGFKDLIVFDKIGEKISCYRNNGVAGISYTYMPQWEYLFPPVTGWLQLKDYNCDGKEDLFAYAPAGMQVWKNVSDTVLKFGLMTMLLNSWQGSGFYNIALTYVDYPGIADIDGDGDLDILVFFGLGTYVQMHRNNSMEVTGTCDSLLYERTFNCWGDFAESSAANDLIIDITCPWKAWEKEIIDYQKGQAKHTGATMLLLDVNNDSLQDLLLGDVDYMNLALLTNAGTMDSAHMGSVDTLFPSGTQPVDVVSFPVPSYLDVDNDGLRELMVSPFDPNPYGPVSHNSVWLYENTGTPLVPAFSFQSADFLQGDMVDVGTGAYPVLLDADGDGLNDLIVADYGYLDSSYYEFGYLKTVFHSKLALFRNTGTAASPEFTLVTRDYQQCSQWGYRSLMPAFGDMDNDGDKDMVCGEMTGTLLYSENTAGAGNPAVFSNPVINWQGIDVGDYAAPFIIDLDGDGLKDLVIGKKNGKLCWYRNTGTASVPVMTFVKDTLGGVDVVDYLYSYSGYSTPCFFRDSLGELKLAVGSERGWIFYYKDIEANLNGTFTATDSVFIYEGSDGVVRGINDGYRTSVCVHDWNDDHKPDLIVGNYRGGLCYYKGSHPLPFSGTEEVSGAAKDQPYLVYPNPCNDYLNISSTDPGFAARRRFFLYDIHGRLLMSQELKETSVNRIPLGQIEPGIYLYTLKDDQQILSGKIIISR